MSIPAHPQGRVQVVDSHTGGEPTRVVIAGGPDLGSGTAAQKLAVFRDRFDPFRTAVVSEPRGPEPMVGALLVAPADPSCVTGVIYFDDAGYLGMCGHGTIGLTVTLGHIGRIGVGTHKLETPVGVVSVALEDAHHVAIDNVESRRTIKGANVDVPGFGPIVGDVAWGGNWFFLVEKHGEAITLANVDRLTDLTWRIRRALIDQGISGDAGAEIDHIELFGPPADPNANSRSFVLCPGKAYDRSPCGTGTSAKLACLVADGKLREGEIWRQESVIGSVFEGSVRIVDGRTYPRIRGTAYVNAEATLLFDPADPFAMGIRA